MYPLSSENIIKRKQWKIVWNRLNRNSYRKESDRYHVPSPGILSGGVIPYLVVLTSVSNDDTFFSRSSVDNGARNIDRRENEEGKEK